jgi:hypothetical protein
MRKTIYAAARRFREVASRFRLIKMMCGRLCVTECTVMLRQANIVAGRCPRGWRGLPVILSAIAHASGAVESIHGSEQTRALDQPWLVVRIDVKDGHEVFSFEIAANWRMMTNASVKYLLATEA